MIAQEVVTCDDVMGPRDVRISCRGCFHENCFVEVDEDPRSTSDVSIQTGCQSEVNNLQDVVINVFRHCVEEQAATCTFETQS